MPARKAIRYNMNSIVTELEQASRSQPLSESFCDVGYRARFQTSSCNSDSANWPGYEAESFTHIEQIEHRAGAVGREGLVN